LAHGVGRGGPATVALCRPASPYVSLGYHRDLAEVDLGVCSARHLPVLRRMVGGGTVYLDQDQLFFQLVVPPDAVPAVRSRAVATLLAPVRDAFVAAGLPARFDRDELTAAGRKLCGHGAGLVGGAVVVVGNLIERFDAEAASSVLAVPDERTRVRLRRRMAMHVGPPPGTPVDATAFARRLIEAARELLGPPAGGGIHGALGQGGDLGQGIGQIRRRRDHRRPLLGGAALGRQNRGHAAGLEQHPARQYGHFSPDAIYRDKHI
jgi:lipoate-protein ligase A